MMETMQTPTTRAEFERRFHLLKEQIRQEKFFVNQGITLGFLKVRFLPNGRIDLLSINESARLQANMIAQFQSEAFKAMVANQESKKTPVDSEPENTRKVPTE